MLSTIGNDHIVRLNAFPALTWKPLDKIPPMTVLGRQTNDGFMGWTISDKDAATFDVTPPADSDGYQLRYNWSNWIPEGHAESKEFASLKRLWDQGVIGDPTDYDDDCDCDEENDE